MMGERRNIDAVVNDATTCITTGGSPTGRGDFSGLVKVSDKVILGTELGYSMIIEVTAAADDNSMFEGTVVQGYFPKDKGKWIRVGDLVEFSRKKIAGIQKN